MNGSRGHGRMPDRDRNLVDVGDDIARSVETGHRGAVAVIDDKAARLVDLRPERAGQRRAGQGSQSRINRIEGCDAAVAVRHQHGRALPHQRRIRRQLAHGDAKALHLRRQLRP